MAELWTITIETGNAAFDDSPATEVARILRDLAAVFARQGIPGEKLYDYNGNPVGTVTLQHLES